jgi:hypothetical protein
MGDHIVRRGAAGSSTRRSEPRPTAELSKQELRGLIRDDRQHAATKHDHAELEPDLEIGGDTPRVTPSASSPRMFAHTLRRAPSPEGLARGSSGPRGDVSTIEMPRVERGASHDPDQFGDVISDDELTRQLRHRIEARDAFDDSIPPAENDFEADCGIDPFAAAPVYQIPAQPIAEMPRYDAVSHPDAGPPPDALPSRTLGPRALRVLTITLAFLIAAGAGYLLMHSLS